MVSYCFFRDDHLSDLIGFEYSRWHGKDAASHFIGQVAGIGQQTTADETPVVSVILDGENSWEYYPQNGFNFIDELYSALEAHDQIRTTTFSDYIKQSMTRPPADQALTHSLESVVAGSSIDWFQEGVF